MRQSLDAIAIAVERMLGISKSGLLHREFIINTLLSQDNSAYYLLLSRDQGTLVSEQPPTKQTIHKDRNLTVSSFRFDRGDMAFIIMAGALVCFHAYQVVDTVDSNLKVLFMIPGLGERCRAV